MADSEPATVIPPERLEAKRTEREKRRREREALVGSVLHDDDDEASAPGISGARE